MADDQQGLTKVAVAQASSVYGSPTTNLATLRDVVRQAAGDGVGLIVFPEAFLTGYVADSEADVKDIAIPAFGDILAALATLSDVYDVYICAGYLECTADSIHNSAVLVGPGRQRWNYRKRHLPFLGADRFVEPGNRSSPPVFDTPLGKIGIAICYEIRFPEVIRTLALAGAELVVLPTAWPTQSVILAEHFTRVRAAENFVYLLAANRPDSEHGVQFLGQSSITSPMGERLAQAGTADEVIIATVDLSRARDKRIIVEQGAFEVSPWRDRRPNLYMSISDTQTGHNDV